MNQSDDLSQAVVNISLTVAGKAIDEITNIADKVINDIAKLLSFLYKLYKEKKAEKKAEKAQENSLKKSDMTDIKSGLVPANELVNNARKTNDTVVSISGIDPEDKQAFIRKAEENGIPISFTSTKTEENAESLTLKVRGSDKNAIETIQTEIMRENFAKRPQEYTGFPLNKWEIDGFSKVCDKYDIPIQFFKNNDNEYMCSFKKTDKKAVEISKNEFNKKCSELEQNIEYTNDPENADILHVRDKSTGLEFECDTSTNLSKSEIADLFKENLGYTDEIKANLGADKFAEDNLQGKAKNNYFNNPQNEFMKIENNVHIEGENPVISEYDCLVLTPKKDEKQQIIFRDENNNFCRIEPDKMTEKQMKSQITTSFSLKESKDTDKIKIEAMIEKAKKVNNAYKIENLKNSVHQFGTENQKVVATVDRLNKADFKVSCVVTDEKNNSFSREVTVPLKNRQQAISELKTTFESFNIPPDIAKINAEKVYTKAKKQPAEKTLHINQISVTKNEDKKEFKGAILAVSFGTQVENISFSNRKEAIENIQKTFEVPANMAENLYERATEEIWKKEPEFAEKLEKLEESDTNVNENANTNVSQKSETVEKVDTNVTPDSEKINNKPTLISANNELDNRPNPIEDGRLTATLLPYTSGEPRKMELSNTENSKTYIVTCVETDTSDMKIWEAQRQPDFDKRKNFSNVGNAIKKLGFSEEVAKKTTEQLSENEFKGYLLDQFGGNTIKFDDYKNKNIVEVTKPIAEKPVKNGHENVVAEGFGNNKMPDNELKNATDNVKNTAKDIKGNAPQLPKTAPKRGVKK